MSRKRTINPPSGTPAQGAAAREHQHTEDRRGFFRSAAAITLGSIAARTTSAQAGDPATDYVAAQLEAQSQRARRWLSADPADFVRPRQAADHNVVIIGGGQSGLAIAYGLKRAGVGRVEVIDQANPGQAGIWRRIARMHQLRTPKTMPGPEQENPMLSVRGWFETLNGADAWDALDRIPRLAWAEYLDWYQQVTATTVRYRTRLLEIEPQGDLLRLHLETEGVRREQTTRKLVLANGYAGAGGANLPGFIRSLPSEFWSHTSQEIDFAPMAGRSVAVIGAGSSAFDAAGVALEAGAAEVHMFNRRPYVDYPGGSRTDGPRDSGHANVLGMTYELPDTIRWKNFVSRDRRVASVPPDSIQRAVLHDNFKLHLEASLSDVAVSGNQIAASARGQSFRFDHLIAGTGYRIDLTAAPELNGIHDSIALWRDRYEPERGWDNDAAALFPYLGAGMEFLPRGRRGAEHLRNIHCFNLAGQLSFGIPVGDIPSTADQPRLIAAIARDLYRQSVDMAAHARFIDAPVIPADPAPYRRAVAERGRNAA
jgi:cation diffusion facilitator CzcD-associated flavoprotein CzcO